MINKFFFILFAVIMLFLPSIGQAVEVAPRISDREIVERLIRLEEGQKALRSDMNQRFETIDQRFEAVDQRLNELRNDMNSRIIGLQNTMLALFGAIITLIVALFGYIVWDRRTMVKPLAERLDRLEYDILRDLDFRHKEGSVVSRLVKALTKHARNDPKLTEILRDFSLL